MFALTSVLETSSGRFTVRMNGIWEEGKKCVIRHSHMPSFLGSGQPYLSLLRHSSCLAFICLGEWKNGGSVSCKQLDISVHCYLKTVQHFCGLMNSVTQEICFKSQTKSYSELYQPENNSGTNQLYL